MFVSPARAFQGTQRNTDRGTAAKEADGWAAVTGVLLSVVMDASWMDVDAIADSRILGIISVGKMASMGPKLSWILECRCKPSK